MYTLYGTNGSGSSIAEAGLERCGLEYRVVRASQIPTLVLPDGTVLTESAAILMHLGLEFPESGLLPPTASARAQTLRGLVYIAANCYSAISQSDYPERYTTETSETAQEAVRLGARRVLHRHWEIFADTFHGHPFLGGAEPGALDIMATIVSKWSGARKHLAAERPEFHALLQRIEAQPSLTPVLKRHFEG